MSEVLKSCSYVNPWSHRFCNLLVTASRRDFWQLHGPCRGVTDLKVRGRLKSSLGDYRHPWDSDGGWNSIQHHCLRVDRGGCFLQVLVNKITQHTIILLSWNISCRLMEGSNFKKGLTRQFITKSWMLQCIKDTPNIFVHMLVRIIISQPVGTFSYNFANTVCANGKVQIWNELFDKIIWNWTQWKMAGSNVAYMLLILILRDLVLK